MNPIQSRKITFYNTQHNCAKDIKYRKWPNTLLWIGKRSKNIDKYFLERDYGQPDYQELRILAVDKISIRKSHRYLTVVLDYLTSRVVFIGKDRKAKTL